MVDASSHGPRYVPVTSASRAPVCAGSGKSRLHVAVGVLAWRLVSLSSNGQESAPFHRARARHTRWRHHNLDDCDHTARGCNVVSVNRTGQATSESSEKVATNSPSRTLRLGQQLVKSSSRPRCAIRVPARPVGACACAACGRLAAVIAGYETSTPLRRSDGAGSCSVACTGNRLQGARGRGRSAVKDARSGRARGRRWLNDSPRIAELRFRISAACPGGSSSPCTSSRRRSLQMQSSNRPLGDCRGGVSRCS